MTPLDYLFGLEYHGIKLGLDNINALLQAAGTPQNAYPTVHVGGTNGKGSTVAFLDHILRRAGYQVGRFTSPHLVTLNERFTISGISIDDSELETLIETYRSHGEHLDLSPTFFEMNTAIAFQHFADQQVDIALIEVGLGGRFDSTNVITPQLSVVTNIDLEHTEFLGNTHESIAFEKAGIIKPGTPVIFGNLNDIAAPVLRDIAANQKSPVLELGRDFSYERESAESSLRFLGVDWELEDVALPLLGDHQAENASVALAAAELLSRQFDAITPQSASAGIARVQWPCRMETVLQSPEVIIDVAHNPAGARTLVNALDRDTIIVLSVATDKEIESMVTTLATRAKRMILTRFDNSRAADPEDLAEFVPTQIPCLIQPDFNAAIDEGIRQSLMNNCPLLITGSLFTAGQARAYLTDHYDAPKIRF